MKPKKAAKTLRAMDRRFARVGGTTQAEWLDSDDRRELALAASPKESRAAKARYTEAVTGVNPVKLAKAVRRELTAQAAADPFRGYLMGKAAHGDKAAAELLDALGEPSALELREYAEQVRKGSTAGEARQRAELVLDGLEVESMADWQRQQALRKEGWQRP